LIKDYDLTVNYTPGKAKVIADALSQNATCNMLEARRMPKELQKEVAQIQKEYWEGKPKNTIEIIEALTKMNMDLKGEILKRQKEDPFIVEEIYRIDEGRQSMFDLREVLWVLPRTPGDSPPRLFGKWRGKDAFVNSRKHSQSTQ
jgi:polyhydroxyalkanoate synthesis regulator phasin